MKKVRLVPVLVLIASLLLTPLVALASTVSGATYSGVIVISNNSTSAASNVATIMTLSSADMLSQGWIDASFSNVAIQNSSGADVPFMPSINATIPWALWVPSMGANSFSNYILYTGGSDMGSIKYYFPGTGGMTITDNGSLELRDNFTVVVSGFVDTDNGSNKNLAYKEDAFRLYVSDTVGGNITAVMEGVYPMVASTATSNDADGGTIMSVNMPSGLVSGDMILVFMSSYNANAFRTITPPDGFTQMFESHYSTYYQHGGWYKVSTGTEGSSQNFTLDLNFSMTAASIRISKNTYVGTPVCGTTTTGSASNPDPPSLTTGFGVVKTLYLATAHSENAQASVPTNYDLTVASTDYAARTYVAQRNYTSASDDPGTYGSSTGVWLANTIGLKGRASISISATGISSDNHTVRVEANGADFKIFVDDDEKDGIALGGASVDDNNNVWDFFMNGVMPYVEYLKIWTD